MKKVMWFAYDTADRNNEEKYPFNIGDVIFVEHDEDIIYNAVREDGDLIMYENNVGDPVSCQLYDHQFLYPIKSNRLAKKLYPNAPEKDGMLWIKHDE